VGPPGVGWYRHVRPVWIEVWRCAAARGASKAIRSRVARRVRVTLTRARSASAVMSRVRPPRPVGPWRSRAVTSTTPAFRRSSQLPLSGNTASRSSCTAGCDRHWSAVAVRYNPGQSCTIARNCTRAQFRLRREPLNAFWAGMGFYCSGELVARVDIEFAVGAGEVVADGLGGDEQCLGDVPIA
jgi:hypothetical protein